MTRAAFAAAIVLLTGCGGEDRPQPTASAHADRWCKPAGTSDGRTFRACYAPTFANESPPAPARRHGRLEVRDVDGAWRRLPVPHPLGAKPGEPAAGHWEWAAVSPDGAWLLAQWTAECEVPVAFFVPTRGGKARPASRDRYGAAPSTALGWTGDGRAIVELGNLECAGGPVRAGVYLVEPATATRKFWKPPGTVERSLAPRTA
jgi:hypothetical protein